MLLYLHDLREYTLSNCGILLSGMPYFRQNLQKAAFCQKEGCAEFLRRINIWHEMFGLENIETEFVCQEKGVKPQTSWFGLRFADVMNEIVVEKVLKEVNQIK